MITPVNVNHWMVPGVDCPGVYAAGGRQPVGCPAVPIADGTAGDSICSFELQLPRGNHQQLVLVVPSSQGALGVDTTSGYGSYLDSARVCDDLGRNCRVVPHPSRQCLSKVDSTHCCSCFHRSACAVDTPPPQSAVGKKKSMSV